MQVPKEDIRSRILTVARQQFEKKGYSKASMREMAKLAGIGVGNIYNYFTNKDELFWGGGGPLFLCFLGLCCRNTTAYGARTS